MKNLLKILWSFTLMTLMILGIGGLVFNTLRSGGWLQRFAGVVWDAGLRNPFVILPLVGLSFWIAWLALNDKLVFGKSNRGADFMVLVLAALGVYALYDWFMG